MPRSWLLDKILGRAKRTWRQKLSRPFVFGGMMRILNVVLVVVFVGLFSTVAHAQSVCCDGWSSPSTGSGTCSGHGGICGSSGGSGTSPDVLLGFGIASVSSAVLLDIIGTAVFPHGDVAFGFSIGFSVSTMLIAGVELNQDPMAGVGFFIGGGLSLFWAILGFAIDHTLGSSQPQTGQIPGRRIRDDLSFSTDGIRFSF